jgi:peptidoglycan hydrolase-like protein with peptidoglycan-binding domain
MKQRDQKPTRQARFAARRGVYFAATALAALSFMAASLPVFAQNERTVPTNTVLQLRVEEGARGLDIQANDPFRATVTSPVGVGGLELIPSGSVLDGRIVSVGGAGRVGPGSVVRIQVARLTSPSGASVNVEGDLLTQRGVTILTVRDLAAGTPLEMRVTRAFRVDQTFFGGGGSQGDDVLDSRETVSQAQAVLRDLGYYNGPMDGRLSPATRAAIGLFQRDQRVRQTGFLDRETIERLGLIGQGDAEVQLAEVLSAEVTTSANNELNVRIATRNNAGMQLFEDHFRQRDAMHIYVRGFRPAAPARPAVSELNVVFQPNEWQGLKRVVVHGSGNNVVITADRFTSLGGAMTVEEAQALEAQVSSLLTQYARALGVRYNASTGQIVMMRVDYRENEIELLFALNSLAVSARLYTQIVGATNDPQALVGATDLFVAQADQVNRVFGRTRSDRATVVARNWQDVHASFERLGRDRAAAAN